MTPLLKFSGVPPSISSRVQRNSLRWALSAWSPVIRAKSMLLPMPFPCGTTLLGTKRLICLIEASIT